MGERASSARDWLRGLFGGRKAEAPRWAGEAAVATGRRAVMAVETLACDTLCHVHNEAGPADQAAINAFGHPVGVTRTEGGVGAVAAAVGLCLSGRRVAAFLPDDRLPDAQDHLQAAVERRLPLVLHVALRSEAGNGRAHGNLHAVASTGALIAVASSAQQALDLTLAAHWIAEQTLTPVVVALDSGEIGWTVQDLQLPDAEMVRELLGSSGDEIECTLPAQRLVFGDRRRRVPRWFDLDRPAALGVPLSGPDFDAAVAGRRVFFGEPSAEVVDRAMERWSGATGRKLARTAGRSLDGARHVIVAQGAALEMAEAVADRLRAEEKMRVGVLGLTWLRPFPAERIREALSGVETVTVLDRGTESTAGDPPLLREIRAVLGGRGPSIVSATHANAGAAEIAALFRNMASGDRARPAVRLGIAAPGGSRFPRREAFLQRVRRDFPSLETLVLEPGEAIDLRPEGSYTVAYHARCDDPPEDPVESLANLLVETKGRHLRGHGRLVEAGLWHATLTAAPEPLLQPGGDLTSDLLLIEDVEPSLELNPLARTKPGATVLLVSAQSADGLWDGMRPEWRDMIRRRELRLHVVPGGTDALLAAAGRVMRGEETELEPVAWGERRDPPATEAEHALPALVRRFEGTGSTYDNVSRFWGEFAQPRLGGEEQTPVPDPYLALGAVPACTATFHDMTAQRERVPRIDPAACSGCGICWRSCPDSAIGVVSLGTEALLNAAADRAEAKLDEAPTATAGKLRRAHRQLAARLDGMLAKSGAAVLDPEAFREAAAWLATQMKLEGDELVEFTSAFEATLEEIATLPLAVTDPFFGDPHRAQKGTGELLMLTVNPQACQGCGVCAAVCPDTAIETVPQTPELVEGMRAAWKDWEALPDTTGPSIARAAEHPRVGPLSAILMSRHCLLTVAGGDGAEPGSGERLATRQVAAVIEYQMQRRLLDQARAQEELGGRLRDAIRTAISQSVPLDDLGRLDQAFASSAHGGEDLGELLGRLEELGERAGIDSYRVQGLVRVARRIEQSTWRITRGEQGAGRARYGLVVAGRSAADWAARFPRNPFGVPLTVDLAGNGADLAIGLMEGLLAERVTEVRLLRRAELLLEAPSDLPAKERELETLTWKDLAAEELALCPPVLVLGGPDGLSGEELGGLSRLLASGLPLKIVLLEDHALPVRGADPVLLALAHRRAFVLAASLAHPDHLFDGVTAALAHPGPALIQVHAPSPARHGFATDATVDRARAAVRCRVHPLLRYDPGAEAVFGGRIRLDGNPDLERTWATGEDGTPFTPAHWARDEARYASAFREPGEGSTAPIEKFSEFSSDVRGSTIPTVPGPNGGSLAVGETFLDAVLERAGHWRTLQELAGVVTPFTDAVRESVTEELREAHAAEIAALQAECEGKLGEQERVRQADQTARLRDRLLQLSGYGAAGSRRPGGEGSSS